MTNAPQLNPWQLGGLLPPGIAFEVTEAGAEPAADPAPAGEPSGGPTATDAGAAVPSPSGEPSGDPAAPAPFNFQDWAQTDEGRTQLGQTFTSWAEQQQAARAEAEAAAARATENPFSDIEEGLGLLGIDPARFKEYLGVQNEPIMGVVEEHQAQKAIQWVDQQLQELGTQHPDLLGEGVDKLAEIVDDDGKPVFDPAQVREANRMAVLYAAAAIQNASVDPRSGQPTVDHPTAMRMGAEQAIERDTLIGRVAVEKFKRELAGTSAAPRDLATGGAGGEGLGSVTGDETAVARRFISERL